MDASTPPPSEPSNEVSTSVDLAKPKIENAATKGRILARLLENAESARKAFIETGREIEKYGFSRDYDFEYKEAGEELFFKAKVAKTAQYIDVVGSALYQTNPHRQVTQRPWVVDPIKVQRTKLLEMYLNYTPEECDLYTHSRRSVIDGLVYGGGVMWTGWNDRKGVVQSVNDTIDNLYLDPDARIWEEMGWVGRQRTRPRVELLKRFQDPAAQKILKEIPAASERNSDRNERQDWERRDFGADQITFYECYHRFGLSRYRGGVETADKLGEADDAPKKYYVTKSGQLFGEEDWEIPFHLDDEWPCTLLAFRERPGSIWPVSPLEVGLGHQKALNWLYTMYLSKARVSLRTLLAVVTQNGQGLDIENEKKALYGRAIEILKIKANGDQGKLDNIIQQLEITVDIDSFVKFQEIIERQFEQSTGLTEFLMSGGSNTQARSAEEVKIKDQKSRTRIEDFRALMEKWAGKVARKEALAIRYLCDPEDIAPIFGEQAAQVWGQLMPPLNVQLEMVRTGMISPDQVRQDGVVFKEWLREADYTIEAGSLRRKDIDQAIDAADAAMNQLVPSLIQEGGAGPASEIIADWTQKKGLAPEIGAAVKQWATAQMQSQQLQDQLKAQTLQLQLLQAQMQLAQLQNPQPQPAPGPQMQQPPMNGQPAPGGPSL